MNTGRELVWRKEGWFEGQTMELIISKLRIHTLKAQWLLRQFHCESLEKEFETEHLTTNQKAAPAYRWDDMLKEGHVLQLMIDLLEKQEKEERGFAESPVPKA
jgi:uncharacterized protein (DUF2225 family)